MPPFLFVPIVEGHGEVESVPILLRRIAAEVQPSRVIEVHRPIRQPKSSLLLEGELERNVELAAAHLRDRPGCLLILLDADDDCPAKLGPQLLNRATTVRPDIQSLAVVARPEFEAWFLAAAVSIRGKRGIATDFDAPDLPEAIRGAKDHLSRALPPNRSYSETLDQPALTAIFDLDAACRAPSFARFCRALERLLNEPTD